MSAWINSDGLAVKFGADEGDPLKGGTLTMPDGVYKAVALIDYTDVQSATYKIVGSVSALTDGALGIQIPEGARIKAIEVIAQSAFTSSGTIGSSVFSLGLKKWSDFSTELDHDGLLTASFVGGAIDAVGERSYVTIGSTGAGALIGTTLSEDGVLVVANTAHASHPFNGGKALVSVEWYYP